MPLVAYYANNWPRAQIFRCCAALKEGWVREILETSLSKLCPCSLSGAKACTLHVYMFNGYALFYLAISRN